MEWLFIILVVVVIIGVITSNKKGKEKKEELVKSIEDDIVRKKQIDDYTTFVERNGGKYSIIGKDSIVDLDYNLFGTLETTHTGYIYFILMFKECLGLIEVKGFSKSSMDIKYLPYEKMSDIKVEDIYKENKETKKSGSRLLRGGLTGVATGSMVLSGLAAASVSKTTTISENYSHTLVTIKLKKEDKQWFAKNEDIAFRTPMEAMKFQEDLKSKLNIF